MLREKLAHKAEDNIGLSQTTQSIVMIISHGGGSCSECGHTLCMSSCFALFLKTFLLVGRPVTSLGRQGGEEFSESGQIHLNYVQ